MRSPVCSCLVLVLSSYPSELSFPPFPQATPASIFPSAQTSVLGAFYTPTFYSPQPYELGHPSPDWEKGGAEFEPRTALTVESAFFP
jgi:hypothetical protein